MKTAADSGRGCGAQGQGAEAGMWRVQANPKWAALHTGRGGGERVKDEMVLMMNGYGWGGGRKEEETNDPENGRRKKWGRRDKLKCNAKRRDPRFRGFYAQSWNITNS